VGSELRRIASACPSKVAMLTRGRSYCPAAAAYAFISLHSPAGHVHPFRGLAHCRLKPTNFCRCCFRKRLSAKPAGFTFSDLAQKVSEIAGSELPGSRKSLRGYPPGGIPRKIDFNNTRNDFGSAEIDLL